MQFFKHFVTITRHRHQVIRHAAKAGILWQGLWHDMSKYMPSEFIPGAKYYRGTESPNVQERRELGYSKAWLHHKGRNRHHFEYWQDITPSTHIYGPVKMPLCFLIEMFCDRVAASKIYQGKNYTNEHPLNYFVRGNARQKMHPDTADLLEGWLAMLAKEGEKVTFAHLKRISNKQDYPQT